MTRQIDFIDELLRRGADINARRCDGACPIQLNNGDYHFRGWDRVPKDSMPTPREIYEHLRKRGAYCDICTAAWFGDLNRVRELCDQDPSLINRPSDVVTYYACSGTPLRNAAGGGHIDIVRLLLERGADPNLPEEGIAPRGHALHSAVVRGHIKIVKLLLEHGAYPNVEIESSADTLSAALASAGYSTKPNTELVELLCSNGAARAVHLLAYSGDVLTAAAVFAAISWAAGLFAFGCAHREPQRQRLFGARREACLPLVRRLHRHGLYTAFYFDVFVFNMAVHKPWYRSFELLKVVLFFPSLLGVFAWLWTKWGPAALTDNGLPVVILSLLCGLLMALIMPHEGLYNMQVLIIPLAVGFTSLASSINQASLPTPSRPSPTSRSRP
jgi:hypothetical protein